MLRAGQRPEQGLPIPSLNLSPSLSCYIRTFPHLPPPRAWPFLWWTFLTNVGLPCFPPVKMMLSLRAKSPSTSQDPAAASVAPDSQLPISPSSPCQTSLQMASQGLREQSQTPRLGAPNTPHEAPTCLSSHLHCFYTLGANQTCLVFLPKLPMFNFTCPYFHHTPSTQEFPRKNDFIPQ